MAVFSIEIRRPSAEGVFYGEAFVTTDHNQTLRIPFHLIVSKGTVHTEALLFDKSFPVTCCKSTKKNSQSIHYNSIATNSNCFQGKVTMEKLHLSSTFNQTLSLRHIIALPEGVPLWFTPTSIQSIDIPPHRKTCVGKVHFDPKQLCGEECFSGFLLNSPSTLPVNLIFLQDYAYYSPIRK